MDFRGILECFRGIHDSAEIAVYKILTLKLRN